MRLLLDGSDWLANYYLPQNQYEQLKVQYILDSMLMDSTRSSGFLDCLKTPENAMRATIPGCDRTILLENGEIDDPYYGRNAERSRWSENAEWAFRKEFVLPPEMLECAHIDLIFHSIGYRVFGFVNDYYFGIHANQFDPWVADISEAIHRDGSPNVLTLIFDPAPKAKPNHSLEHPSEFSQYHCCQMSFGWDWARGLVPVGIFDHVEIHAVKDTRISDVHFKTCKTQAAMDIELWSLTDHQENIQISLTPQNGRSQSYETTRTIQLEAGRSNLLHVEFDLPDAQFWYPNMYGEQPLYDLEIKVDGDSLKKQVGFRDLQMVRNTASPEQAYPLTFEINGEKIFARGLNWVPADMMFSRLDENLYERQVRMAKEAGFNLMRVWGGGLIEKEEFYAACDRYGMLVWQEFPHACSEYPADDKHLREYARIGEAGIRKLRNHVSTALFCGGNEILYYGEDPNSSMLRQYAELVQKLAPEYPYHLASPDMSRPGERVHGPWCFRGHSFWNKHFRYLASELGCEGFAEEESINRFIPANDPIISGQHWKYHFTFDTGQRKVQPMLDNFKPDMNSRWQVSQASMFQQADELSYVMTHYRNLFPKSSGCYIWQYNESWPTNSFSIIDFYSLPKIAYYYLANANKSNLLFLEDESFQISNGRFNAKLYAVCDRALPEAECSAGLYDIYGRELDKKVFTGALNAGSTELAQWQLDLPANIPGRLLLAKLVIKTPEGCCFDFVRLYGVPDFNEALHLPSADAQCSWSVQALANGEKLLNVTVSNISNVASVNLRLKAVGVDFNDIFWQENYFTLLPGESRSIRAKLTAQAADVTDIELKAWNISC